MTRKPLFPYYIAVVNEHDVIKIEVGVSSEEDARNLITALNLIDNARNINNHYILLQRVNTQ